MPPALTFKPFPAMESSMHYGIHVFPTESSIQPAELARAAEERGLESAWFSEHTHIPLRFLEAPGRGPTLPAYYWQTYDLFVAMALAAGATERIKIGSGVALLVEHHPINLAKATATLDTVSRGRLLFGVGAGWLEAEMADHGTAFRTRFQYVREEIRAIKQMWAEQEPEFHGRFIQLGRMRMFPKPYQRPHPPIIIGGSGEQAIDIAAELCDGWAPWGMPWPRAQEMLPRLREKTQARGRDPSSVEFSMFDKAIPDEATRAQMEEAGIRRFILTIYDQPRDEALASLDALAALGR